MLGALGVALFIAGRRNTIGPATTAIVLGVIGTGLGAQVMASDAGTVGASLGLLTMLALLGLGVALIIVAVATVRTVGRSASA